MMRLSTYLALMVNTVIMSAFLAYAAWSAHSQSQQRIAEIQHQTITLTNSLAVGVAEDLLAENLDRLENQLTRTITIGHLQEITVADAKKHILAQVERTTDGKSKVVFTQQTLDTSQTETLNDARYTHTIPIERGKLIGWVSATSSLQGLAQLKQQIWRDSLIAGFLISLLTATVLLLKLRTDSRAIAAASYFAAQLAQQHEGKLQIQSPIRELRLLQDALNRTSGLLKQQFYDLEVMDNEQKRINDLLQMTINDLAAKQFALDQHAIVSITDLDGKIVYVNDKFTEISQYSQQELLGQNHRIIKSGLHDRLFYEQMWQTIRSGKVWHGEIANRRKDGSLYWVSSTIVPLLDINGQPNQYIAIRTDISYRKRTEQQLSANQAFLEKMVTKYRDAEKQISEAHKRELDIGSQIQHTLLFGEIPARLGSLSLAVYTEPSKGIDGDFYQFLNFSEQYFDLSLGDVMGKGVPAALIGAAVKQQMNQSITNLLAHQREQLPSPAQIINHLHQQMTPRLIALETFVTLVYLRYDLTLNQLTFVDAGHTTMLHCHQQTVQQLSGNNLPIGVMEDEMYQQHTCQLQTGDLLFLYSDGVTEARNPQGEEFGVERLSELLIQLQNIPSSIVLQAVRLCLREFEQYAELRDDRSCVALQLENHPLHTELAWEMQALSQLRHALKQQGQLSEAAQASLTLASIEVLTNIIRHSPKRLPDATIHCYFEPCKNGLAIDFYYLGHPHPPQDVTPDFSGNSEGGFGLFIIQNSVDYWHNQSVGEYVCWVRLEKWQ